MQDIKEKAALGSIVASGGLTIAKAVVGLMTGSLAILSEAAHSLIDLAATIMTYAAVRISGKPADADHQYGHGKVESVSALAETALLFVLAGVVVLEATKRLLGKEVAVEATVASFLVIGLSIAVDFFRSRHLYRVAGETSSEALEADALHFSTDLWSSAAVAIGLVAVALGYAWADAVAAIVVAVFICIAGWRLARRTVDTLLDTAPAGASEEVTTIANKIPGIVAVERVRTRRVGPQTFIELNAAVSRTLPIDRIASIKEAVARNIRAKMPDAEVSIITEPRALDDETILDRVSVIARNRALAVHHITVHDLGDKLSISLDLEVDGSLALAAAHDIASGLEAAIIDELGPSVEVETHIEPLQPDGIAGTDAGQARVNEVSAALAELEKKIGIVGQVHNVRVRQTEDGEIVNFHCRVDPNQTVHAVHEKVDELERSLRRRFPSIKRVIGHAEPGL